MESNASNLSMKLRPHLICSKTGGTWVEVVVVFFSFFLSYCCSTHRVAVL